MIEPQTKAEGKSVVKNIYLLSRKAQKQVPISCRRI